jgi:hypothetical protein
MKKNIVIGTLLFSILLCACKNDSEECRIHGTVNNPNLEGKCIYLIAEDANIRDSVGVDSAFIENGKFEIKTKNNMMAILRMDYHFRYGTQDLLVVEEPGDVYVSIDTISSGSGTEGNNVLQRWKNMTEVFSSKNRIMMVNFHKKRKEGDSIAAKILNSRIDSLAKDYRIQSKSLANTLPDGPLKDFFAKRFPNSYKKYKKDGSYEVVEID